MNLTSNSHKYFCSECELPAIEDKGLLLMLPAQQCPPFDGILAPIQSNLLKDDCKELFQPSHLLHHQCKNRFFESVSSMNAFRHWISLSLKRYLKFYINIYYL